MALRKTDIDSLEIREKRYRVHEGSGLYLEVMPTRKKFGGFVSSTTARREI